MTGIERLRFYAGGGELLGRDVAREVVAHIDAQDQRIQELEAALSWARSTWWPWVEQYDDDDAAFLARVDALLAPAPGWPSLHGGVQ